LNAIQADRSLYIAPQVSGAYLHLRVALNGAKLETLPNYNGFPEIWEHWAENNFKKPTVISEATHFKDNKHKTLS